MLLLEVRALLYLLFPEFTDMNGDVEGAPIHTPDGSLHLGTVTSGIPSPSLGKNIAMGYVTSGHHKKGTELAVDVRGKLRRAVVTPMPFVQTRYYRGEEER